MSQPIDTSDERLAFELRELVSRGSVRVPPYPATALKLQDVLGREDYTTNQLVDAMKADPVFTANLLRLANSPIYRRGAEVTSLQVAVARIGPRELVRLALASSVGGLSRSDGALHSLRREVWRQALACAMVTEVLSRLEGADQGEGFVAGLLHDAGKLLVLVAIEDLRSALPSMAPRSEDAWLQLINWFHVPFGALLAERWQLPGVLGAVVTTHHSDPQTLGPLTRRVVLADRIVECIERSPVVTVADLEACGLARPWAEAVAAQIPRIPLAIASFEPEPAKTAAVSLVEVAPATEAQPLRGYTVEVEHEPVWQVLRASRRSLEVKATRALAPNVMLEITVRPSNFSFWAVVERVEQQGDAWLTELAPFALPPEHRLAWEALSAGSISSAA
jgi:HD-like signal output (HDOD) protein